MDKELNKNCNCGNDDEHSNEDCDCGHDEDFVIDLEDDNGNIVSCPIIDTFEFEENEYLLAQSPEDDSVYMFKSVGEELIVPEEEEFNKVATYYNDELVQK